MTAGRIQAESEKLETRIELDTLEDGNNESVGDDFAKFKERRISDASDSSSNKDCSELSASGKYHRCSKYATLALLAGFSLVCPPSMIYSGIAYIHCDTLFPPWLLVGALLWYILLVAYYKRRYETCCGTLIIITPIFFIWWLLGFSRIMVDGKEVRNQPMMQEGDCKLYMYWLPFFIAEIPVIFFAGFLLHVIFLMFFYVCCMIRIAIEEERGQNE